MSTKSRTRQAFRDGVFQRDKFTCQVCGRVNSPEHLNAHHITDRNEMPKGGYVISNGITVCDNNCHMRVEQYHITGGEHWNEGLHPDDLYKKIGSSKQQAIRDSER